MVQCDPSQGYMYFAFSDMRVLT